VSRRNLPEPCCWRVRAGLINRLPDVVAGMIMVELSELGNGGLCFLFAGANRLQSGRPGRPIYLAEL
jgi:hypothetical protein